MHAHIALIAAIPLVFVSGESAQEKGGDRPAAPPAAETAKTAPFETITRKLPDDIVMTADLYKVAPGENGAPKPVLACFHMTGSSRGEYRKLAPQFMEMGFNVLAVDLRFGGEGEFADRRTKVRSGTMNETWKMAKEKLGRAPVSIEALPDIAEAVKWAHELFPRSRVGLIGSSFSASLVLVYAAEHPREVDAVVSLSPGEYFQGTSITERAKKISVPTYITCGNTVADSAGAKSIAAAVEAKSILRTYWPNDEGGFGDHGTRSLLIQEDPDRKRQWDKLALALEPLKKPIDAKPIAPAAPK